MASGARTLRTLCSAKIANYFALIHHSYFACSTICGWIIVYGMMHLTTHIMQSIGDGANGREDVWKKRKWRLIIVLCTLIRQLAGGRRHTWYQKKRRPKLDIFGPYLFFACVVGCINQSYHVNDPTAPCKVLLASRIPGKPFGKNENEFYHVGLSSSHKTASCEERPPQRMANIISPSDGYFPLKLCACDRIVIY
jgi:hypothetical protein